MIDFEKEFQKYLHNWMKENDVTVVEEIEDMVPVLYEKWLTTPSEAFLSIKPVDFFRPIENPIKLMEILGKYIFMGLSVPGPLLNEIGKHEEEIYPLILTTINSYNIDNKSLGKFVTYCIELIDEMDKNHPTDDYIRIIKESYGSTNVIEIMTEALRPRMQEKEIQTNIKNAYLDTEHEFSKDCFLDLISELPNDEDAYKYVMDCFMVEVSKSGLYAHMLAKIGNDECNKYLIERLKNPNVNYFNYMQIKEALEELGGICEVDRNFDGDADFDRISSLDYEDPADTDLEDEEFDE